LTAQPDVPVVTVVAPAGYGKTALMRQWAALVIPLDHGGARR